MTQQQRATSDDAVATTSSAAPIAATIAITRDRELGQIDRKIYGHFLEANFFGNIEGGIFDEGSPLALTEPGPANGLRRDVLDVCRELGVPIARWPGGNFASAYHWEDGIGPRDQRPRRLDVTWGGEESNRFGTDEFLAWCAAAGAEPFLVVNCRSVEEAVRWVEYTNYGGDTAYTRQRAANGHPTPYGVRYWGVGNEVYGLWQMGHRPAEQYAADLREHARFMRLVDPTLKLVAVGLRDESWTRAVLERAGAQIDYISIHLYGASTHLYTAATGDNDYDAVVAQPLHFETELRAYADMVATLARQAGVERPLALAFDEWNNRHLEPAAWPAPQPGVDGGIAPRELPADVNAPPIRVNRWSPRTLTDALFYAGVFQALQRLSGLPVPVSLATTVNLINANAPLVARPGGVLKSATYYVWDLYQNHTEAVALPVTVDGPGVVRGVRSRPQPDATGQFPSRPMAAPYLDAVATTSHDRRTLTLTVINRHETDAIAARLILDGTAGALPPCAHVRDLGANIDDVLVANSFSAPARVATRDRGEVRLADGSYCFPPHSLTVLTWNL
jgi:alpha-N-arabinofuranosidase